MRRAGQIGGRGRDEHGSALVISMIAMSLMLMLGLAALAMTDQQTKQSGVERVRESSFNLAEGALQQQSFLLGGRGWPKAASDALPAECSVASTASSRCPTPTALVGAGAYDSPDYVTGASWKTYVRDNTVANPLTYTTDVDARPTWDSDANGYIWVKSTATVRGRTRTIVALLKRDPIPIALPRAVLVSGGLTIPQNGQSGVITTDATTPLVLRCDGYGGTCNQSNNGQGSSQISPNNVSYTGATGEPFLQPDIVAKLIDSAKVYTTCPTEAQITGLVVIDPSSNDVTCELTGNTPYNSPTAPGVLLMTKGRLDYRGNGPFYGLIIHLNQGNDGAVTKCVDVNGTPDISGGIIVEGTCGVEINGNSRLIFNPNMFNLSVTGVAGLVQNTWRELPAS
ncbi:MAG: hypothetical protein ACLGI5_04420 [Thermoleophilia bacterium]